MHGTRFTIFDRLMPTKIYTPGMHKLLPKRLNWEEIENRPQKEAGSVVKGTSKHIVVVKSPDPKVFEQAIFIVREDFFGKKGRANALKEAQKVADDYIRCAVSAPKRTATDLSRLGWISLGVAAAGLIALAVFLIF